VVGSDSEDSTGGSKELQFVLAHFVVLKLRIVIFSMCSFNAVV